MFEELLIKVSRALTQKNIPYMIIGGQAVLLYGTPRLTKDIDITLGVNIDHLPEIIMITKTTKLKIIPKNYQNFVAKTMVLPALDKTSGIRIDFIFSSTHYERQAIGRARQIKIGRAKVKFASVEDVIIHKIFAGRPRDIEDVRSIILKHPDLDVNYIKRWLKGFDRASEKPQHFLRILNRILKNP